MISISIFVSDIGEGLSGALYWKTLYDLAEEIGFETPRTFSVSPFNVTKPELKKLVGMIWFVMSIAQN